MDVLRASAMAAVVAIHTTTPLLHEVPSASGEGLVLMTLNQASRFAVPAFVFLTGMGLSLSPVGTFRKRAGRLLPDYFLWTLIYSALAYEVRYQPFTPTSFVLNLLTGGAWYHLYFVPMVIALYALAPFIAPILSTPRGLVYAGALTLAAQGLRFANLVPPSLFFLVKSVSPIVWLFYFALGTWAGKRAERISEWGERYLLGTLLALAVLAVLVLEVLWNTGQRGMPLDDAITQVRPIVAPYAILVILIFLAVPWPSAMARGAAWIHRPAFGVYLAHPLLIVLWRPEITEQFSAVLWVIAWTAGVVLLSLAVTVAVEGPMQCIRKRLAGLG